MDAQIKLIEIGEKLGYEGEELKKYVKEQMDIERDERAKRREEEKEQRET